MATGDMLVCCIRQLSRVNILLTVVSERNRDVHILHKVLLQIVTPRKKRNAKKPLFGCFRVHGMDVFCTAKFEFVFVTLSILFPLPPEVAYIKSVEDDRLGGVHFSPYRIEDVIIFTNSYKYLQKQSRQLMSKSFGVFFSVVGVDEESDSSFSGSVV